MFGKQKVVISSMLLRSSCDSFNLPRACWCCLWFRPGGRGRACTPPLPPIWAIQERAAGQGIGLPVLNRFRISNHRPHPRIGQVTSQGERGGEDHEGQLRLDKL